jgi:tetratricopeptide (TPR) repeat protein
MGEGADNHYQVLRIERTADERAVKKAYFTLIREFPPDTHPEEFKRLRAAYEVLSDPVARQRFDNSEKDFREYGDEVGAKLREIAQLQKSGDEAEVQQQLRALLEEHPSLVIARENLGFSLLRGDAFKEALEQFDALASEHPEEARYHLYRGLALNRIEQPDKALAAVRMAHKLKPEDLGIHLALIDLLKAQRKYDACIKEVDRALDRFEPTSEQGVVLCLRKIEALFAQENGDEAEEEVSRFFEIVRKSEDPELPKYVSSQLTAAAARLFARNQCTAANAVLRRCEELDPESLVAHPCPRVADLDLSALPKAGADWLARQAPGETSPTIEQSIWRRPLLALVGISFAAGVILELISEAQEPQGGAFAIFITAVFVGLAFGAGYVARAILGILRSPLRAFITLHPLYFLRVRADRIRAYSLFHLADIKAVHHHTNGRYTHTAVDLWFGTEVVRLTLTGRDFAEGWVQYLTHCRARSLELMMEGYLEAEHGVELIPLALLTKSAAPKAAAKAEDRRWYAGMAAVGVAAGLFASLWHARVIDDYAYRLAVREHSVASYTGYLAKNPGGRHTEGAKRQREGFFTRAIEAFRGSANEGAPGAKAILGAIDALQAAGAATVPVTVVAEAKAPDIAGEALERPAVAARAVSLVERLGQTLDGIGLSEVMHLRLVERGKEQSSPVTLSIRHAVGEDGARFRLESGNTFPSLTVDWEVILSKGGAPEPLFRFTTTVEPPEEVELALAPAPAPVIGDALFTSLLDSSVDAFMQRCAVALGLPGAAPAPPRSPKQQGSRP